MEKEEKTEGIVLRAFDYKDRQRIVTLFSQDAGLISVIIKGLSKKNYRLLSLSTPFSQIEILYSKGKSDLFRFVDGSVLEENMRLREQYAYLQAAGSLAQAVLRSQMPGKPSPALYLLFRSFLKQIPTFANLSLLVPSFQLKLLRHEGLLSLTPECAHCQDHPARFLLKGESVCEHHYTPEAHPFTPTEWNMLLTLDQAQSFSSLNLPQFTPPLADKISTLFHSVLSQ